MKLLILYILLLINITTSLLNEEQDYKELIDPSTLPQKNDTNYYYLSILHTNDIHGSFYPKKILLPSGDTYTVGGLEYLGKYIKIMKEEWGDQFMYLDSGDHFQGGIEGYISKGQIIMDFFKSNNISNSPIGNHEFDYGVDFLNDYMNTANFEWLIANVKNTTQNSYECFPKQKETKIYELNNGIKIGIIGILTEETLTTTSILLEDLYFEDYAKIINTEAQKMKNEGVNCVIVLAHVGMECKVTIAETKLQYLLRDKNTEQECSSTDEAAILLPKLNSENVDIFLGGHKHSVEHIWINDILFASNDRNGKYADIVYLPFDRKTKKLNKNLIKAEGPLPICEKIFNNINLCDEVVLTSENETALGELVNFKFHGKIIDKEENISKIGQKYQPIYDEYDKDFLTYTLDHFESSKLNENNLGNLYCDFLRHISGADISVINPGNFRTPLYRGNITNATVQSFDPFGNELVKFEIYGWEVKKMFSQIQKGSKGFYPSSGLRMIVKRQPKKLLSIKYFDGVNEYEIEDNKIYTMIGNIFCFPIDGIQSGGDDFNVVYKWFKPRNPEIVVNKGDDNSRDLFINYLRNINQLKENKYYDKDNLRMRIIES